MTQVKLLTSEPLIAVLADMRINQHGLSAMAEWVREHRPECLPDGYEKGQVSKLFPHTDMVSDNELLAEVAGRKCYDSFGLKAGRKSNREYIENTQGGDIPHASILYHPKMSFFIAGVSRRVSQEMMRNYVGADRDQEGSPSQESTRFTHHYGTYVAHPSVLDDPKEFGIWGEQMQAAHDQYEAYIERKVLQYRERHEGEEPKGMHRKRIYESAIGRLPWDFETSYIWTTNPVAIAKFIRERDNPAADREIQRFAKAWKKVVLREWPNLFTQPWMQAETAAGV
jgi:thymidylate synthase (FAD)